MDLIQTADALPAPSTDAVAERPVRRTWLHFVIDHNPFYLLSAAFMLLGCRMLNGALHTSAGDVRKAVMLLAVIQLYEFLIIPLGLALLRRPWPVKRDGIMLLVLEALFLADVTFTSTVVSTVDVAWGVIVNSVVLALAAVKLFIIFNALHVPRGPRICLFVLLQLALLLLTPVVFKDLAMSRNGKLPAVAVYAAWCVAGILPVLGTMLHRLPVRRRRIHIDAPRAPLWVPRVFIVVPFVGMLSHLYSSAWVYSIDFAPLYLAPVLIGLAVAAETLYPRFSPRAIARLQMATVLVAIWLSASFPDALVVHAGVKGWLVLSPLRVVLVGSAVVCAVLCYRHRRYAFMAGAVVMMVSAVLGNSLASIRDNLEVLGRMLYGAASNSSPLERGVAAVGLAFLFLAVGAFLSLRRPRLNAPRPLASP